MPIATPSQTVGPYFRLGLDPLNTVDVAPAGTAGRVRVTGVVTDADGQPIPDCVLEIWQADAHGEYAYVEGMRNPRAASDWQGFARVPTDASGRYAFFTTRPGRVAFDANRTQAPHALVLIGMRGLLKFLMTRMYFPGDELADDPVLALVPQARRETLIAKAQADGSLRWDVRSQGQDETVFFDY